MPWLVLILLHCACASPSPRMAGAVRHGTRLQGIDFAVFHKDDMAEVIRLTFIARPVPHDLSVLMAEVAAITTGCEVIAFSGKTLVSGDTGVARFDLDCWGVLSPRPRS